MTATSKNFTAILDAAIASGKPIDQTLMTAIRDSLQNLNERIGASFSNNTQDHNHDGVNSAKVQIGSNMLRNGDFENALIGWTQTIYTGGSIATTTNAADGVTAVQITSTVLGNGGGDILSNEFMVCVGGGRYGWSINNWASVANISSKLEAIFYDNTQSPISTSVLLTNTSTPTTNTRMSGSVIVPTNAKYMKLRATGGIPATGSATGTIYFDSAFHTFYAPQPVAGASWCAFIAGYAPAGFTQVSPFEISTAVDNVLSWKEFFNARIMDTGTYRITYVPLGYYGNIYKNGAVLGTQRNNQIGVTITEDWALQAGDTIQIFASPYNTGSPNGAKNFGFSLLANTIDGLVPPQAIPIGAR